MPLPKCFENFIGLRQECGSIPPPRSGLYFEDLEGLRLDQASQMADGSFTNGADFLRQKFAFALRQLTDEILNLLPRYTDRIWNGSAVAVRSGGFGNEFIPPGAPGSGLKISLTEKNSLTKLTVERIFVLSDTDASAVPVTISDGYLSQTYAVDIKAYVQAEVITDFRAQYAPVFITWNGIGNVNDSRISASRTQNGFKIEGWDGSRTGKQSFGLQAEVSLKCDEEQFMCRISHRLGNLLLYRTGIETAKERLASDRLNRFSFNKEEAARLLDLWQAIYDEKRNYLLTQFNFIDSDESASCFSCGERHIQTVLP